MIYDISVEAILLGALIFIRISAILFALPFFGDQPIPVQVRVLVAVALAFGLHAQIPANWISQFPADAVEFGIFVVKEVAIGLFLGFVGRMTFDAIVMAASFVGYQMGFSTADLMMPGADSHMSSFTALHRTIMMMIFLSLNLHYIYIDGIVRTFQMIPAGGIMPQKEIGTFLIGLTSGLFRVSMQMAAPVLVALLFANTALGLIARTVPQLNAFSLSFPLCFGVGMLVYVACLPFFPAWTVEHFDINQTNMLALIKGLRP